MVRRRTLAWTWGGDEEAAPVVRFATAGVVVLNLAQVVRFCASTVVIGAPGEWWRPFAAAIVFLPPETFLLVAAIRSTRPRLTWPLLACVAVPLIAVLPVTGANWTATLSVLVGLSLIYFRPPASFAATALVLCLGMVSALEISRQPRSWEWVVFGLMDSVWVGLALAVLVWLTRTIRELDAARRQLAVRALVIERQRIDDEVARTLGAALDRIAARGELAAVLARTAPGLAAEELLAITASSRATLAQARGMLSGFREVSARAELDAAVTLLSAAGVRATLRVPDSGLPGKLSPQARAALRAAVACALTDSELREYVLSAILTNDSDELTLRLARVAEPACQDAA